MDLFDFITLIGGLAFFLFGMNVLSEGLERLAGGKPFKFKNCHKKQLRQSDGF